MNENTAENFEVGNVLAVKSIFFNDTEPCNYGFYTDSYAGDGHLIMCLRRGRCRQVVKILLDPSRRILFLAGLNP